MATLIILRGNSGSGKTSTARLLQQKLGGGAMLVSQDVVRREMLSVKDDDRNPAIQLIYELCRYGQKIGYTVILEGILSNERYGDMLRRLLTDFYGDRFVYYFDIPFEETLRRHRTKPNCHEFGEAEMREWWKEKDYLGTPGEVLINETMGQDEIVQMIISDVMGEARKDKGA